MEYYRELSFNTYGLDPAHYIGLPSYTWDAGLKLTNVKLENINDINMIMMFEKSKRGGISVISERYAKANNPYLPDYNKDEKSSYLLQLDRNNLYGWAMMQKLPVGSFEWKNDFKIKDYDVNGDIGYMLEVDLLYPNHLHEEHNDYPLAPEHLVVDKTKKLCPNLNDKEKYVVYIDNLKYYLQKGMILSKIHRVIKFDRRAWLEPYITKNSILRVGAKNDFEKDFYKLMNNAFYGKTMENERGRVNIQFCLDKKSFEKHFNSPLFASQLLIIKKDGLCLVKTHKKKVELKKPIYTGCVVLELSKLTMFEFHYDTMKKQYPSSKMLKTDTDSLLYYIETDDVYKDMKNLQTKIEFSNYPKNHELYNIDNKKNVHYFQDECVDGKLLVISEYVGLRAKSYANKLYNVESQCFDEKKKCKGISSIHLKKRLSFDNYKTCLFDKKEFTLGNEDNEDVNLREKILNFRSIGLQTYTIAMKKLALSYRDNKRIILKNGIQTYAIGHYKTK
jgi:uncharacterized protein YeeX (DUF496 family)